jgi:glutamine cyclotransferase
LSGSKSKWKGPPASAFAKESAEKKAVVKNDAQSRTPLILMFVAITLGGSFLAIFLRPSGNPERYTFEIVRKYPHDPAAFTQGLLIESDGQVVESTGQYGKSDLRKYPLATGEISKRHLLPLDKFGEGVTRFRDQYIQVTWKEKTAYVYDLDFNLVKTINYDWHGWGLTSNDSQLIMSDGTASLRFLNPETFAEERVLRVMNGRQQVSFLNELELVNEKLYANQWNTDFIYEIDINSGDVTAIIDLRGLWPTRERPTDGILNGIAVNPQSKLMVVTGKYCPWLYEIKLKPK